MQYSARGNAGSAGKLASARRALQLRILSAAVLITAALLATLMGGLAFLALVLIFAGLVHREWFRVPGPGRYRTALGLLVACWVSAAVWYLFDGETAVVAAMFLGAIAIGFAARDGHKLAMAAGGYIYIVVPALVFLLLREPGIQFVVFLFLVVWLTDTGAFAAGKLIGGPKLWPAVSPNKTWSGAVGGVIAGCGAGVALSLAWGEPYMDLGTAVIAAFVVSVAGQIGDLGESAWKRHFNVKDSGGIIPGHGGVMDRLDSLIVAAPVLALVKAAGGA